MWFYSCRSFILLYLRIWERSPRRTSTRWNSLRHYRLFHLRSCESHQRPWYAKPLVLVVPFFNLLLIPSTKIFQGFIWFPIFCQWQNTWNQIKMWPFLTNFIPFVQLQVILVVPGPSDMSVNWQIFFFFFASWILNRTFIHHKSKYFMWVWYMLSVINIVWVLWLLMAWWFSTRESAFSGQFVWMS